MLTILGVQYQQLRIAIMKKILLFLFAVTFSAITAVAQQSAPQAQPSLADLARKARTQQKAAAIARYDEESFKGSQPSPPEAAVKSNDVDQDKDANKKSADAKEADSKGKDTEKAGDDLKAKIDSQKNEISLLQREVDVLQREQRLRAAAFYADAGTQFRDQAKFAEDSRKQQEDIDAKKQALDAAQQKLADLEEQARKAGVRPE
jgi:hypothetical protein